MEEYPDTELESVKAQARPAPSVRNPDIDVEDVLSFIQEHCLPRAMSIVTCDQASNNRVAELKSLSKCNGNG